MVTYLLHLSIALAINTKGELSSQIHINLRSLINVENNLDIAKSATANFWQV